MILDSEQALRLFLVTGLPQAYTYGRMARRRELAGAEPRPGQNEAGPAGDKPGSGHTK